MLFHEKFLYCPACGSQHFNRHNEKSKQCADCGFVYYLNPSSAVAAFIVNNRNELLVCKRGKEPAKGTLDLPGGFVDCNETNEEAVAREIKEETGAEITDAKYLFSLPNEYLYSDLLIPTLDTFFSCKIRVTDKLVAADDVAGCFYLPIRQIHPNDFGLPSVRKAVNIFINSLS